MNPLYFFLLSLAGLYFNSVLFVWFATMFSKHGLIFSPSRGFTVAKPLLKCLLSGAVPGIFLTYILAKFVETATILLSVPLLIGVTISAWLLHKEILIHSQNRRRSNTAVLTLGLAMAAIVGMTSLQMG
ncbi:hypothetical protein AB1E33_02695 [Ruegeria sp. 2012CJ15-1]